MVGWGWSAECSGIWHIEELAIFCLWLAARRYLLARQLSVDDIPFFLGRTICLQDYKSLQELKARGHLSHFVDCVGNCRFCPDVDGGSSVSSLCCLWCQIVPSLAVRLFCSRHTLCILCHTSLQEQRPSAPILSSTGLASRKCARHCQCCCFCCRDEWVCLENLPCTPGRGLDG